MRFLAVVILAASNLKAAVTQIVSNEIDETTEPMENKQDTCTYACALKLVMFDEDKLAKDFLRILVKTTDEENVDSAFETCAASPAASDNNCEKYLDCIETELDNRNITFLFSDVFDFSK